LREFDAGEHDVLVGCDNLSRGINLERPQRVINWAPPYSLADYLNRIGRCGRLNQSSVAHVYTYATYVTFWRFLPRYFSIGVEQNFSTVDFFSFKNFWVKILVKKSIFCQQYKLSSQIDFIFLNRNFGKKSKFP